VYATSQAVVEVLARRGAPAGAEHPVLLWTHRTVSLATRGHDALPVRSNSRRRPQADRQPYGPKRPLPPFLDGVAASHSGNARRTSKRPNGRCVGRGIRSLRHGPDVLVQADEQALAGGAPTRPRPGTGYPPRAPTCLCALTCALPQRAFVRAISLGLQINERGVGVNGWCPDREDKPDRSRALWAIGLMLADGVNAEPRACPPTNLAAIQRHVHRIPINAAYQPTARQRTARIARAGLPDVSQIGG
jgi:hypothetical protein